MHKHRQDHHKGQSEEQLKPNKSITTVPSLFLSRTGIWPSAALGRCRVKKKKKREVLLEGQSVSHINTKAPPWQPLNESVEIMLPTLLFSLQQNYKSCETLPANTGQNMEIPCFMIRLDMYLHAHLCTQPWLLWAMLIQL